MCDFIKSCYAAPRINKMADFFSSTASGVKHKPLKHVKIDNRLFPSPEYIIFLTILRKTVVHLLTTTFAVFHTAKKKNAGWV
ncbi:hypothetical protein [Escherichia coli]|uniref:hypothetical protein n=1 Tax=Escherichia coli TaxID=562 RepID=UPI001EEC1F8B|nr:hypothetical protein [Escherichia coli]